MHPQGDIGVRPDRKCNGLSTGKRFSFDAYVLTNFRQDSTLDQTPECMLV